MRAKVEATRHPPTPLRVLNLLAGLALVIGALCGLVAGVRDVGFGKEFLPAVLNLWVGNPYRCFGGHGHGAVVTCPSSCRTPRVELSVYNVNLYIVCI
jgi:hypothetical protein